MNDESAPTIEPSVELVERLVTELERLTRESGKDTASNGACVYKTADGTPRCAVLSQSACSARRFIFPRQALLIN